jgi:hypothetical protein
MGVAVNKILEELDELSIEEKEFVKETFDKMLIEARREEILQSGEEARKLHREGKLKAYDNAEDFMKSLMED